MFTAYTILLGHNIIPHHHHDNRHDLTEHHHENHNHDDEDGENLSDLFSHFIHSADGFTLAHTNSINNTFSKQVFIAVAALPFDFYSDEFLIPPLLHKPPAERFIYVSSHSLSSGLRAPPAFIG